MTLFDERARGIAGPPRRHTGRLALLAPAAGLVAALVAVSLHGIGVSPFGLGTSQRRDLLAAGYLLAPAPWLLVIAVSTRRCVTRRLRTVARYRLELPQSDEAAFEDVAASCEQLVQVIRTPRLRRLLSGQPWLAIETWFVPPVNEGETGSAALALVCEPRAREGALAALRHAYPDLRIAERLQTGFVPMPDHVLRVRKARSWALPIGSDVLRIEGSNQRSTMAAIIRQQQQAARLSCVRWCILPAAERQDSRATERLERLGGGRTGSALLNDVTLASRTAGGAMAHLELQAAIWRDHTGGRRGFMGRQAACRELLAPALSQRGPNHLRERVMAIRQGLYRRRWSRAEPPLVQDRRLTTLVSPRELAALMALPSLGSEHALPFKRNTVPHLPIPVEAARARMVELPVPPGQEDRRTLPEIASRDPDEERREARTRADRALAGGSGA